MAEKIKLTKKQRELLEAFAKSVVKKWSVFNYKTQIQGVKFHITWSALIGGIPN